jgi:uncharacterized MnhB-related membrane protein
MLTILTIILCVGMVVGSVLAITLESLTSAVISAGLASLFASVVYLLLSAPDVAMTEAAIGSGLTTMIFLYTLKKTGAVKEGEQHD